MTHVERSAVADLRSTIYGTVGRLGYMAHGMTEIHVVSDSACEVWVVVPGCLLGRPGLLGRASPSVTQTSVTLT